MEELAPEQGANPVLVSNLEVYEMLEKQVALHKKQKEKARRPITHKYAHRDWIASQAYNYLSTTQCAVLQPSKRSEFKSKLTSNKRRAVTRNGVDQSSMAGFGLTEGEATQVMNFMPTEPVEFHLMIEELQGRFSEKEQEEMIAFVASYRDEEKAEKIRLDSEAQTNSFQAEMFVDAKEVIDGLHPVKEEI